MGSPSAQSIPAISCQSEVLLIFATFDFVGHTFYVVQTIERITCTPDSYQLASAEHAAVAALHRASPSQVTASELAAPAAKAIMVACAN